MSLKKIVLIYFIAIIVQLTILNLVEIFQVTPNLILCSTITLVFLYKDGYKCILLGTMSQLIVDFSSSPIIGVGALSVFLASATVVIIRAYLNVEKLPPLLATGIVSVVIYNLIYVPVMSLLTTFPGTIYLLGKIGISLVFDSLIMSIMFFFMIKKVEEHNSRYGI